jgi:hypothetical protein
MHDIGIERPISTRSPASFAGTAIEEIKDMKYVRIALLSAAAIYLLPFATPATAQLSIERAPACARCGVFYSTSSAAGAPVIGPELGIGVPLGATALAPAGVARPLASRCHVEAWDATYPREYHVVCP